MTLLSVMGRCEVGKLFYIWTCDMDIEAQIPSNIKSNGTDNVLHGISMQFGEIKCSDIKS